MNSVDDSPLVAWSLWRFYELEVLRNAMGSRKCRVGLGESTPLVHWLQDVQFVARLCLDPCSKLLLGDARSVFFAFFSFKLRDLETRLQHLKHSFVVSADEARRKPPQGTCEMRFDGMVLWCLPGAAQEVDETKTRRFLWVY